MLAMAPSTPRSSESEATEHVDVEAQCSHDFDRDPSAEVAVVAVLTAQIQEVGRAHAGVELRGRRCRRRALERDVNGGARDAVAQESELPLDALDLSADTRELSLDLDHLFDGRRAFE